MAPGETLTLEDLDYKRPGTGIGPDESQYVIGRSLRHAVTADQPLSWDDFTGE